MNTCRVFCLMILAVTLTSSGCDHVVELSDLKPTEDQLEAAISATPNTDSALETVTEEAPAESKSKPATLKAASTSAVESSEAESKEPSSDGRVDPVSLLGTWKWIGNPRKGQYVTVEYKQNTMTFHANGRYSRFTSLDPEYFDGQTQFLNGEGRWRLEGDRIEVEYQSIRERDTTRIIQQYPGVEIIPGVTTRQVRQRAFTFKLDGNQIQRDDGSLYRRISSDPDLDPKSIVDHEAKRLEAMYERIYSPEYGY